MGLNKQFSVLQLLEDDGKPKQTSNLSTGVNIFLKNHPPLFSKITTAEFRYVFLGFLPNLFSPRSLKFKNSKKYTVIQYTPDKY